MTQYLISVWHDEGTYDMDFTSDEAQRLFAQVSAFNEEVQEAGAWVFGGGLVPPSSATVVRAQDGVEAATYANWVGDRDMRNEDVFFAVMAVDPESYLQVYDEILITDAERDRWLGERRGALVGDVLARKLNLRVGGRITLTGTIYPGRREYIELA